MYLNSSYGFVLVLFRWFGSDPKRKTYLAPAVFRSKYDQVAIEPSFVTALSLERTVDHVGVAAFQYRSCFHRSHRSGLARHATHVLGGACIAAKYRPLFL